jgi:4-phosphopantoate--beta-alanine ligase
MSEFLPKDHPRYESIRMREHLVDMVDAKVLAPEGLIAHGRGEAFDYLIGEKTPDCVLGPIRAAAAALLTAERPIISLNGNAAALCPEAMVELAEATGAKLEINLFYRSRERIEAITKLMEKAGAREILGTDEARQGQIPEIGSERKRVDSEGILIADTVFVPLEDGDRTEALVKMGKRVITIDLNPLSRTSRTASISIMDHIVRAVPAITRAAIELKKLNKTECLTVLDGFDNDKAFAEALRFISARLKALAGDAS